MTANKKILSFSKAKRAVELRNFESGYTIHTPVKTFNLFINYMNEYEYECLREIAGLKLFQFWRPFERKFERSIYLDLSVVDRFLAFGLEVIVDFVRYMNIDFTMCLKTTEALLADVIKMAYNPSKDVEWYEDMDVLERHMFAKQYIAPEEAQQIKQIQNERNDNYGK